MPGGVWLPCGRRSWGLALILGIGIRIASATGALLLVLMWLAALWLEHNPFLDDHLIYALVLIGVYLTEAGRHFGLGNRWTQLPTVANHPWLK